MDSAESPSFICFLVAEILAGLTDTSEVKRAHDFRGSIAVILLGTPLLWVSFPTPLAAREGTAEERTAIAPEAAATPNCFADRANTRPSGVLSPAAVSGCTR